MTSPTTSPHRLNLLPLTCHRRLEHARQRRHWISILAVVIGALSVYQTWLVRDSMRQGELLQTKNALAAPLRTMEAEIQQLRTKAETQQIALDRLDELERSAGPMATLLAVSESCADMRPHLMLDRYQFTEAVATSGRPGETTRVPSVQLVLVGSAASDRHIASLVLRLRENRLFEDVTLDGSQATHGGDGSRRTFQIRCETGH